VLGVPYQQLHKYETGANRLSAGRLFLLAEALGVEVAHFFGEDGADGLRVDLALLQQPQHRLADRLDGGLHPVRGLGLVVVHHHLVLWCHKLAGMG
jgi:transcriptional regulator with XRE-family HTH domain